MNTFTVSEDEESTVISSVHNLKLILKREESGLSTGRVYFSQNRRNPTYNISNNVNITAHDINQYLPEVRGLRLDPEVRYAEIGAGLGEFIPKVVSIAPRHRPLVVDPAPYALMLEYLGFAYENVSQDTTIRNRLGELSHRCRTILDPAKVILLNERFEKVFASLNGLSRSFDVVVDNYGLTGFYWTLISKRLSLHEVPVEVNRMERVLLKENGSLYSTR